MVREGKKPKREHPCLCVWLIINTVSFRRYR